MENYTISVPWDEWLFHPQAAVQEIYDRGRESGRIEALKELEARYSEALMLYTNTREKFITSAMDETDRDYWQGRKDGMRVTLALVAPDPEDRERWQRIQDSTPKSYTDILGEKDGNE